MVGAMGKAPEPVVARARPCPSLFGAPAKLLAPDRPPAASDSQCRLSPRYREMMLSVALWLVGPAAWRGQERPFTSTGTLGMPSASSVGCVVWRPATGPATREGDR